jgi:hypothetical protein
MTLIITMLHESILAQVSDTRLTNADGTFVDGTRKVLFYVGFGEHRGIATAGMADVWSGYPPMSIVDWLTHALAETEAQNFPEHIGAVLEKLDPALEATSAVSNRSDECWIVMAGYDQASGDPSVIIATNRHERPGSFLTTNGPRPFPFAGSSPHAFGRFVVYPIADSAETPRLVANGHTAAVTADQSADLISRLTAVTEANASQEVICKIMLDSMKQIASADESEYISSSAWVWTKPRNSSIGLMDTSVEGIGPFEFVPNIVGPGFTMESHIQRPGQPFAGEAEYRQQFSQGDLDIAVSADSLAAYLRTELVEPWLRVLGELDVEVGHVGLMDRTVAMLGEARIQTIRDVDRILSMDARLASFVRAYFSVPYRLAPNVSLDRHGFVHLALVAKYPGLFNPERLARLCDPMGSVYARILESLD